MSIYPKLPNGQVYEQLGLVELNLEGLEESPFWTTHELSVVF